MEGWYFTTRAEDFGRCSGIRFLPGPDPGAITFREAERQYWTVGNRPIRKNDLRSLHRNSVEAQIQDRSRQKTGLNTAPAFSRVYNKPPLRGAKGTRAQHAGDARNSPPPSFPRAIRHSRGRGNPEKTKHTAKPPLRAAKGTRAQHAGDARKPPTPPFEAPNTKTTHPIIPPPPPSSPHPLRHSREPSVIPASHPSFPRTREPSKNKARRQTSPSRSEGDACAARRGCPKTTNTPPSKLRTPRQPLHHPPTPSIIPRKPPPSFPASLTSFPRAIRHSRGRGNPEKNKAHRQTSPSRSEGDACAARRGCPKTTNTPPSKLRTPRQSISSFPSLKSHKSQFRRLR